MMKISLVNHLVSGRSLEIKCPSDLLLQLSRCNSVNTDVCRDKSRTNRDATPDLRTRRPCLALTENLPQPPRISLTSCVFGEEEIWDKPCFSLAELGGDEGGAAPLPL